MDFVFITDLHLKASSKVRTGDLLQDLSGKLNFVVDYTNSVNGILLLGGDIFDKPSVPDLVKTNIAPIFLRLKNRPLTILGNHDRLFENNSSYNKTSYAVWATHNIITPVDNSTLDLGDVIVTNELPIVQRGKPQLVLFHGFLNVDDGINTFRYSDIGDVKDQVYVLLGHDHCEYEPLIYKPNIEILRPGSLLRQTREEASLRQPKLLHITVSDGLMSYKLVEIKARPYDEIFVQKLASVTKAQQSKTYDAIISQIRNSARSEKSLEQILQQISSPDVCTYIDSLLKEESLISKVN